MSNIIDDADVTHYSSQFENKDFYITENDIADLDLFFMVKTNGTLKKDNSSVARIVREPVFYFSCSSHTAIAPVFGVGHDGIVGYSRGNTIYAGKIITNAFHNIPLINLLIEAEITSGDPADLPPLDFYIVNKKRKESATIFSTGSVANSMVHTRIPPRLSPITLPGVLPLPNST